MAWNASLALRYRSDAGRTTSHDRHEGPLRVLASLYPEGGSVCHQVVVHPPGGIVGGDALAIHIEAAPGAHALLTTPGAARFYRSDGAAAMQSVNARLAAGARLEWLPLEAIAHPGCLAVNDLRFALEPGAEMMGWDLLALGLPASGQGFDRGRITQSIAIEGRWLERGRIDAADARLLASPLGLAGRSVLATLWFAAGAPIDATRSRALLDAARELAGADALGPWAGATAPDPAVLVLRVLAERVEPAAALLRRVWARWRELAWRLPPCAPRVWST